MSSCGVPLVGGGYPPKTWVGRGPSGPGRLPPCHIAHRSPFMNGPILVPTSHLAEFENPAHFQQL